MLEAMCQWGKAGDVLELVNDWLEAALKVAAVTATPSNKVSQLLFSQRFTRQNSWYSSQKEKLLLWQVLIAGASAEAVKLKVKQALKNESIVGSVLVSFRLSQLVCKRVAIVAYVIENGSICHGYCCCFNYYRSAYQSVARVEAVCTFYKNG